MHLIFKSGKETVGEPTSRFMSRPDLGRTETIVTDPGNLCITLREDAPVLRVAEGGVREFAVCESFIDTLLAWHDLGAMHLKMASNETAVSFFNDLLLAIAEERVSLIVRDGEARAIAPGGTGTADV